MPFSKIHQKKKGKNYTLLVVLLLLCVILFFMAIVKIKSLSYDNNDIKDSEDTAISSQPLSDNEQK